MPFYELLSQYYDDVFPVTDAELSFVADALNPAKTGTILDIGCGTGGHSLALASLGFTVLGLDLEPGMVERARAKALLERVTPTPPKESAVTAGKPCCQGSARFLVADMTALPAPDASVEGCLCIGNTLAHLPDPGHVVSALEEMARVLKTGGTAVVQVVNFDRVLARGTVHLPFIQVLSRGLEFERRYELSDDGGVLFRSLLRIAGANPPEIAAEVPMTPIPRKDLERACTEVGLEVLRVCGDFAGRPHTLDSPGTIMVLAKPSPNES